MWLGCSIAVRRWATAHPPSGAPALDRHHNTPQLNEIRADLSQSNASSSSTAVQFLDRLCVGMLACLEPSRVLRLPTRFLSPCSRRASCHVHRLGSALDCRSRRCRLRVFVKTGSRLPRVVVEVVDDNHLVFGELSNSLLGGSERGHR